MEKELTVIIPTLNEENYLPTLLTSLVGQSYDGKFQVIVVDGESEDDTVKVAESFVGKFNDLSVVKSVRDIGTQKNLGAQQAKYKYLLFLDADVELPGTLLDDVFRKMPKESNFTIGVMHKFRNLSITDKLFYYFGRFLLKIFLLLKFPIAFGDFIFVPKKTFNDVIGFKEGTLLGEDVDFCMRTRENGAKSYFYMKPYIYASIRRAEVIGRTKLMILWLKAFAHVKKHGPIYPEDGFDYEFGHYASTGNKKLRD